MSVPKAIKIGDLVDKALSDQADKYDSCKFFYNNWTEIRRKFPQFKHRIYRFFESASLHFDPKVAGESGNELIGAEIREMLEGIADRDYKKKNRQENKKTQVDTIEFRGVKLSIEREHDQETGKKRPNLYQLAKEIRDKLHVVNLRDSKNNAIGLYYYEKGVYNPNGDQFIKEVHEEIFAEKSTINGRNELVAHVLYQGFTRLDNWLSKGHIVVNNGNINLQKLTEGESPLEPWSPDVHAFNKLDIDYIGPQRADLYENHITLVIPDESDRDRFQKFVGSFLETDNYAHQKIIILYGIEGSGKTVTLRVLSKLFGIENIAAKSFQQLAEGRFDTADLFGVMANICEELPQNAIRQIERLNSLTGGLVSAEKKNQSPFWFYQNAKLVSACNDLPAINGDTTTIRAFMSRVLVIVFNTTIRGTDREIQNFDDMMLEQKSGILNWILEGYRKYRESDRKITSSKSTDETLDFYIANSDFMAYFIKGCTVQGDPNSDLVIKEELWHSYLKAARVKGTSTVTRQTFLSNFLQKFPGNITSERTVVRGKQEHVFRGLRIKKEQDWFKEENEEDLEPDTGQKDGNSGNLPRLPTLDDHIESAEFYNHLLECLRKSDVLNLEDMGFSGEFQYLDWNQKLSIAAKVAHDQPNDYLFVNNELKRREI